jgi:DNA primase
VWQNPTQNAYKYSRQMDYILVVEGYMDVVALHQSGVTKVVATDHGKNHNRHIRLF